MTSPKQPRLITPRLTLRPAALSDLGAVHRFLSDAEVMRYWSTAPHATLEESRTWLEKIISARPSSTAEFLVEHAGAVIGKVGLWRMPEVGYIFAREAWGKGFAHEAMTALIAHVEETFAPDFLTADVDPRNTASLRLLDRLGFHETGRANATWFVNGSWADSIYLARPLARTQA